MVGTLSLLRILFALLLSTVIGLTACGDAPTSTAPPTANLEATVAAMVEEALPTPTLTPTPDTAATVEASVQATVQAQPTSTTQPTSTPIPTEVPTPVPYPTPTPTPTPLPTPTPSPTLTPTVTPIPTATVAPTPTPTPTATPRPTRRPQPTATPAPTATPRPTATPTPIGPAPLPRERSPSSWGTYSDSNYAYSIDYPENWQMSFLEGGIPYFFSEGDRFTDLWIRGYRLPAEQTLEEFANWYREDIRERSRSAAAFDIIDFEHEYENRRDLYRLKYTYSSSTEFCTERVRTDLFLSYAFPGKPYGYAISSSSCVDELTFAGFTVQDMIDSFREWNFHLSNIYGWSISAPSSWVVKWEDDGSDISLEGEDGQILVSLGILEELDQEETLEQFAERRRGVVKDGAAEVEFPIFEITSFETATHRGRETIRFTYRRQVDSGYCVEDIVVIYSIVESSSDDRWGIGAIGIVCESGLDEFGAQRDAIMENFRP